MKWFIRALAVLAVVLLGTVGLAEAKLQSRFETVNGKLWVMTDDVGVDGRKKVVSSMELPAEVASRYVRYLQPKQKAVAKTANSLNRSAVQALPALQASAVAHVIPTSEPAAEAPVIINLSDCLDRFEELKNYRVTRIVRETPEEIEFEYMDDNSQFHVAKTSVYKNKANEDKDNPRRYNQLNIDRPDRVITMPTPEKDDVWTVSVVRMPRAMAENAGRGLFWGTTLREADHKLVKTALLPLREESRGEKAENTETKSATIPAVSIVMGKVDAVDPVLFGDRHPEKRWWTGQWGRTVVWNRYGQATDESHGFFNDPHRLADYLKARGGEIAGGQPVAHLNQKKIYHLLEQLDFRLLQDGEVQTLLMPGASVQDLVERRAQIPAIYFHQRLFKAGFPSAIIPFSAFCFGAGAGGQVVTALAHTSQYDIECLPNQKGGFNAFWAKQYQYQNAGAAFTVAANGRLGRFTAGPAQGYAAGEKAGECADILASLLEGEQVRQYSWSRRRGLLWLYDREIRWESYAGAGTSHGVVPPGTVNTASRFFNLHWRPFGWYGDNVGFWFGPAFEYGKWDWLYRSATWRGDGHGNRAMGGLSSVYTKSAHWGGIKWYDKLLAGSFHDNEINRFEALFGSYFDLWHRPLWQSKNGNVQIFSGFSGGVEINTGSGLFADLGPTILRVKMCGAEALRVDPGIRFLLPWPAKENLSGWGVKVTVLDGAAGYYPNFFPGHLNFHTFAVSIPRTLNWLRRIKACGIREIPFPEFPEEPCQPAVAQVSKVACPPVVVKPPVVEEIKPVLKKKIHKPKKKGLRKRVRSSITANLKLDLPPENCKPEPFPKSM